MTLLAAWISRDHRRPSAVYIAADSRITAGDQTWDCGKKVFSCKTQPWIFGFCGSVLVPTQILAELTDAIDCGLVIDPHQSSAANWESIRLHLEEGMGGAAPFLSKAESYVFGFHRTTATNFDAGYYTIRKTSVGFTHMTNDSKESAVIKVLGSGKDCFDEIAKETRKKNSSLNVTRIFFASFCRTVRSGKVRSVGGVPQLATLRTRGPGCIIPILFNHVMYHQGVKTDVQAYAGECFDETFQRIDPKTGLMPKDAQRQPLR